MESSSKTESESKTKKHNARQASDKGFLVEVDADVERTAKKSAVPRKTFPQSSRSRSKTTLADSRKQEAEARAEKEKAATRAFQYAAKISLDAGEISVNSARAIDYAGAYWKSGNGERSSSLKRCQEIS